MKLLAVAYLGALWSPADAHIPGKPIPEIGWNGPGHLCETSFTLRIEPNEYVREDIRLEPSYPASDTVKSADGWYGLSVGRNNLLNRHKLEQISANSAGEIYRFKPIDPYSFTASLIFIPRDATKLPIEIEFFRADQPNRFSADWRAAPQKSYDPNRYKNVLDRIDFLNAAQTDCLNK